MSKRTLFPFCFHLLLVLSLDATFVSCNQAVPTPKAPSHTLGSVETWIQQHAIPFKTAAPGGSDVDLQPLKQIVGNATIVGLGEATHGTHEFFTMKHRILEFLVNEMGFTTFAIENGWDVSRLIDTYVMTGRGSARALLLNEPFLSWQTQEVLDLIEWMRAYNANPSHTTKVHFAGIDCTDLTPAAFQDVLTYIQSVDPQQSAQVQAWYAGIDVYDDVRSYALSYSSGLSQAMKEQNRTTAQKVYNLLKTHQTVYERRSSPQAFALALHIARVIVQFTIVQGYPNNWLSGGPGFFQRDEYMAENVAWLHDQGGGHVKMVLWAHNAHIANDPSYNRYGPHPENMGAFLREWYQQSYRPIGTSFYQGTCSIFPGGSYTTLTLPTPATDTYNYTLGSVGIPRYILDLRQVPAGPVTAWMQGPRRLISIGFGGEQLGLLSSGSLQQWFDVIIHFQTITPSKVLH